MAVVKFTSYFIMPVHGLHCHVLIVFESAILCEYIRDEIFTKTFKSCFIFTNDGIKTFHCIAVVSKNIGLMYNADWTHGLDSRTGLSNFAGNDFKAIIQKFSNSCNTRDTIIAL